MANRKIKIIFIGTPEFGAIILKKLIENEYKPDLVITASDKPVGRKQILTPSSVKILAQKYKIPVLQSEKIENLKLKIESLKPDLGIVAAYGQIIPKNMLNIPKYGFINVHPSLLPKYRGASPIQSVILNGEKKTGITIILMDEKIDHGPILSQRSIEIEKDETSTTLYPKLANLGAELLIETILEFQKGLVKSRSQENSQATYTKTLTRQDGKINWKKTAEDLNRQIRAYDLWPGSFTFWQKRNGNLLRIKILKARFFKSIGGIAYSVGKILVVPQNEIGVQCGILYHGTKGSIKGGDFLAIEKLQIEGKEEMNAEDFLRGHPDFIGTILK